MGTRLVVRHVYPPIALDTERDHALHMCQHPCCNACDVECVGTLFVAMHAIAMSDTLHVYANLNYDFDVMNLARIYVAS